MSQNMQVGFSGSAGGGGLESLTRVSESRCCAH